MEKLELWKKAVVARSELAIQSCKDKIYNIDDKKITRLEEAQKQLGKPKLGYDVAQREYQHALEALQEIQAKEDQEEYSEITEIMIIRARQKEAETKLEALRGSPQETADVERDLSLLKAERKLSERKTKDEQHIYTDRMNSQTLKDLKEQLAKGKEAEEQRKEAEAKFRYIFSTGPYQKCFIVLAVIIGAIGFDYIMMHRLANSTDTTQSNSKKQKTNANKKQMSAKERSKLRRRHYLIGGCLGWISSYIIVVLYNAYEYQQKSQSAAIPTTVGSPLS